MNPREQQWLRALDACRMCERDLEKNRARMDAWYTELRCALQQSGVDDASGLHPDSTLARQAQAIGAAIEAHEQDVAAQWTALAPAQTLAHSFKDKIVLLVFGKFNAGKSSLCARVTAHLGTAFAHAQAVHFGDYLRPALALARITPEDLGGHAAGEAASPAAPALGERHRDPQSLYQALERAVRTHATAMAHSLAQACHASLCDLDQRAQAAQTALHAGAAQLSVIEEALRA